MSSIPVDQFRDPSPIFSPPQSTQPFQSLFGGPSSQDVNLEPYPETQPSAGVEEEDHDELDLIMGDLPAMEDDQSDATYHASDEDESEPNHARNEAKPALKKRKRPTLKEDPMSPPSSPVHRPNRFLGPESTWRKLTAEERQNAQALETIRARDLAAHLYNAYALRVRAHERGQKAARRDRKLDESEAFVPPKRWTAWPMPADEVPRVDEHLRREEDDAWTLRMLPDPRPSANLEESVIAIMLETAKDRLGDRRWDRRRTVSQPSQLTTSHVETNDESTGYEGDWKSDQGCMDDAELRPVVQADDDKSRRQLRPISRKVLTQFDQLLMGLHNAQKGSAPGGDSSASEGQTDTESMASGTGSPRKRNMLNEKERSQSRGRRQTRRSSCFTTSTDTRSRSVRTSSRPASAGPVPRNATRSRGISSRPRSASRIRHGFRDWSEVLGVAAMVGWPPAVVMRAAKRCSGLFGEDMAFQTFREGKVDKVKENEQEHVRYIENESEPERTSSPSRSVSRQSRSRSRATSLKRESTSRAASPAVDSNGEVPLPKGKGEHRRQDLVCPLKKCSRHTDGFSRTWNLNLHMKRMHPGYRPRDSGARTPIKVD